MSAPATSLPISLGQSSEADIARATPAGLAWWASQGQWELAPHLDLLNRKLLAVAAGVRRRLMVMMPPRHGKSEFLSRYLPAWYLGTFPERRVLLASYEHDFAASWGAKARDAMRQYGPDLWGLSVRKDKQASDDWQLQGRAGGMICAGVGGALMGRGANLFIIDDPVKNADEAASETLRNRTWEWYRSTAYTRLEPGAAIVLIMTRWHEADLAGGILEEAKASGEVWEVISLPALAEPGDPLGRQPGEALWPARYPVETLHQIRRSIGAYWFSALYQQRPAPPEGQLLKKAWWQRYRPELAPPASRFETLLISVDCSYKDSDGSDYVVMQVWGRRGPQRWLLDQVRDRMDFPKCCSQLRALAVRWPMATLKLVEDKANGGAVVATLRTSVSGLVAVTPLGSKLSRVQAVAPEIEAGNVFIPDPRLCSWADEFVNECAAFPHGARDDMCVAAGTMIATLRGDVPIEEVTAGERVLTPYGAATVSAAGQSGQAQIIAGLGLLATPDHGVFAGDRFRPLMDALTQAVVPDKLSLGGLLRWQYRMLLSSRASATDAWGGRAAITLASQLPLRGGGALEDFTWRSGSLIRAGRFREAGRFITSMMIRSTTTLRTWSVYRLRSTLAGIRSIIRSASGSIWNGFARRLRRGTEAPRGELGTGSIEEVRPRIRRPAPSLALSVAGPSLPSTRVPSSAAPSVVTGIAPIGDTTMSSAPVSCAGRRSRPECPPTRAASREPATGPAARSWDSVYNLAVDGAGCYYANGILVSNCDAMSQALLRMKAQEGLSLIGDQEGAHWGAAAEDWGMDFA